jgi:RNA polymerase primary sigma factor
MRFDEERGVRFISYAVWWVRQAMVQALSEFSSAVRIPVNRFGTVPIARGYLSLDTNGRPSDDGKLLDILPDESSTAPDEEVTANALAATVNEALSHLAPREALVIRKYFGFDGREGVTLEEIGAELGVTRERARQIKERALHRLRIVMPRERDHENALWGLNGGPEIADGRVGSGSAHLGHATHDE